MPYINTIQRAAPLDILRSQWKSADPCIYAGGPRSAAELMRGVRPLIAAAGLAVKAGDAAAIAAAHEALRAYRSKVDYWRDGNCWPRNRYRIPAALDAAYDILTGCIVATAPLV